MYVDSRLIGNLTGVSFKRRHDPVLSVRVANRIHGELENLSNQALIGSLRDEPPVGVPVENNEVPINLAPGETLSLAYHVTPPERGSVEFQGTYLRLACPLGLSYRDVRLESQEVGRVYPNVLALKEFNLLNQQGRLKELGIRRSRMRGIGSEFESLREYADGDDFRRIDHKATARRGKLIVRQYETEKSQAIVLVIDIGRHMLSEVNGVRKLDHILDSLLMLTNAASVAGDMVGLLVMSDTVRRYIPPRKGRTQVGVVIEACHDLVAEPVETDINAAMAYLSSRWKRRSLVVAFSDYEDQARAKEYASALRSLTQRHLVLAVRVQDGKLNEAFERPIVTPDDAYGRAAASLVLRDRKEATKVMSAARVHQLESEPQNLAKDLVNFYLNVKERGLL
jgi:uncharacterized protein (DUF58 family)